MTERKALKLALEAFEAIPEEIEGWIPDKCTDAVIAIKEALAQPEPPPECQTEAEKTAFAFGWFKAMEAQRAQPEQEPVAITTGVYGGRFTYVTNKPHVILPDGMGLYASPQRTWVGLTDVERRQAVNAVTYSQLAMTHAEWVDEVQKATEATLKEKNT